MDGPFRRAGRPHRVLRRPAFSRSQAFRSTSHGALSVAIVGTLNNEVKLTGSLTAEQNGVINMVTRQPVSHPQHQLFSQKTLATPIQVVAGQSIAVTVVYSFS